MFFRPRPLNITPCRSFITPFAHGTPPIHFNPFEILRNQLQVSTGQQNLLVTDLGGTQGDIFCRGPLENFLKAFQKYGVKLQVSQVTNLMGLPKDQEIHHLCQLKDVRESFLKTNGFYPGPQAQAKIYREFLKLLRATIHEYSEPTPGCIETNTFLRSCGLKVAVTTGLDFETAAIQVACLQKKGFQYDYFTAADKVKDGSRRLQVEACMKHFNIPPNAVIFLSDAHRDFLSCIRLPVHKIAVSGTSTHHGIVSLKDAKPNEAREERVREILEPVSDAVIHTLYELPSAIAKINNKLHLTYSTQTQALPL